MNCQFQTIEPDVHQCAKCKFVIRVAQDPAKIYRKCPIEGTGPSLVEKALNFTAAMMGAAVDGFKLVDEEERNRRLAICGACPNFEGGKCKLCSCLMSLKTRLNSSHCPDTPPRW